VTVWSSAPPSGIAPAVMPGEDDSLPGGVIRITWPARIRASSSIVSSLGLKDRVEDILITLDTQYHLIRLLKGADGVQHLFLYLVLDRGKANLALARHHLKRIEADLAV
jgi:hypothetical protein